jgi:ribosomal subunit interface protein
MNNRLRITFKDTERTEHLIEFIEERFERLRKTTGQIIRCSVVVSSPHRSHRHGNAHEVTIALRMPGRELVGHARSNPDGGADLYSAICGGFNSLNRQVSARRRTSSPPHQLDIAPPVDVSASDSRGALSA